MRFNNLTIQQFNNFDKALSILMLLGAIVFNLWLYRLEPEAKIDPNDNAFQFALVDRTNQIWNFAARTCSQRYNHVIPVLRSLGKGGCHLSFLVDHWVPNWAEGYNLPYYYSHIPQITIVASYRFINFLLTNLQLTTYNLQLFSYYHLVIYLLLALFPLSVFWALRVSGLSWLTAGSGALLATQISTDGLYGLDPSSFLWRGYGLSSQLFAMIFLPQAIAYSWKYLSENSKFEALNPKQIINPKYIKPKNTKNLEFRIPKLFRISDLGFRISCFWSAVFFLIATTAGHLGIGIIALLSLIPLSLAPIILLFLEYPSQISLQQLSNLTFQQFFKLVLLAGTAIFFLSYWIIPILLNGNYHNISFWDPVWKFNSYGAKEVIIRLLNGDLFDFGRFPVFTLLVISGFFTCLWPKHQASNTNNQTNSNNQNSNSQTVSNLNNSNLGFVWDLGFGIWSFALLFIFWLFMYFGRTTWGGLIDLVPGMKDFHLSRFIVGLHLAGLFLAPIGLSWITENLSLVIYRLSHFNLKLIRLLSYCLIVLLMIVLIYPQTVKYNELNNTLIVQANGNFAKIKPDIDALFARLKSLPPGRVFAGRGGWGKNFKIAETPVYMHLSTYGLPTVLWLPETWSPNSDVEQFFREDKAEDYDLFNITYVVAPPDQPVQPFWKLTKTNPSWKLYEVKTGGYITHGNLPAIVSTGMRYYVNLVHQWIHSDNHSKGLYPELTFDQNYPKNTGLPNFRMIDEANYIVPDGTRHNLYNEPPLYLPLGNETMKNCNNITISGQTDDSDMIFKATVAKSGNDRCLVILKQSGHPGWQVTVDGKKNPVINVFPFFAAVVLKEPGTHEVVFAYRPSGLKVFLLIFEGLALTALLVTAVYRKKLYRKKLRS